MNHRLTASNVYPHAKKCIDKCKSVSSRILCRFGDGNDIRNIGTKLNVDGLFCCLFNFSCDFRHIITAGSEGHSAAVNIRAGNINLKDTYLRHLAHGLSKLYVFRDAESGNVGDEGFMKMLRKLGDFKLDDFLHAGVLKTHGIDHALIALGYTGELIAVTLFDCCSFEGNGSQYIKVIKIPIFFSEPEGSGCRDHRVTEFDSGKLRR